MLPQQFVLQAAHISKPGSAMKFNQYKKEGCVSPSRCRSFLHRIDWWHLDTDFVALGHDNAAWNVVRSEFDHLLLDHAASLGAKVYEDTQVVSLGFDEKDKPASAAYAHRPSSDAERTVEGTITFDYLVDATGRAGLMSIKYLKSRRFTESLKNIAVWGYWAGVHSYGEGTTRAGAPWFEALAGVELRSGALVNVVLTQVQQTNPGGHGSYLCIRE